MSKGPWKKHKYFQKIGEGANAVYRYAKKKVGYAYGSEYKKEAELHGKHYEKQLEALEKADRTFYDKSKEYAKAKLSGDDEKAKETAKTLERNDDYAWQKLNETMRVGKKAIDADFNYKHSLAYKVDRFKGEHFKKKK